MAGEPVVVSVGEMPKVFGIGLNKTGTTSLAASLKLLGYQRHMSFSRELLAGYRGGDVESLFAVTDAHDSFEDWPWPLVYRELFDRYGDRGRYVLTTRRSPEAWLESLTQHSFRTGVLSHCRLMAYGYNYPHGLEAEHIRFYLAHNQAVRDFFAANDAGHLLLEFSFDAGDGWEKLCGFLGLPVPDEALPHERRGEQEAVPDEVIAGNALRIREQLSLLMRDDVPVQYRGVDLSGDPAGLQDRVG